MHKETKKRKPRGIKKNGTKSYDLCKCCYKRNCDPCAYQYTKVEERLEKGLCPACGKDKKDCICKSKL